MSFTLFSTIDGEGQSSGLSKLCPVNGHSCRRSSCSPASLYPPHELVHFIILSGRVFYARNPHFSTPGGRGTHARPGAVSFDKNTQAVEAMKALVPYSFQGLLSEMLTPDGKTVSRVHDGESKNKRKEESPDNRRLGF